MIERPVKPRFTNFRHWDISDEHRKYGIALNCTDFDGLTMLEWNNSSCYGDGLARGVAAFEYKRVSIISPNRPPVTLASTAQLQALIDFSNGGRYTPDRLRGDRCSRCGGKPFPLFAIQYEPSMSCFVVHPMTLVAMRFVSRPTTMSAYEFWSLIYRTHGLVLTRDRFVNLGGTL